MGTYERKTREIKRSLHRRARMRRAYFKMIGEDPKKKQQDAEKEAIENGEEINLSDASDSGEEAEARPATAEPSKRSRKSEQSRRKGSGEAEPDAQEPKLTGRQLARRKRAEEYHRKKELEENIEKAKKRRDVHKHTMMKRNTRGQPKLGSQVGVLLDKIRKSES